MPSEAEAEGKVLCAEMCERCLQVLQAALLGTGDEVCEQPAWAREEEKQIRHTGDRAIVMVLNDAGKHKDANLTGHQHEPQRVPACALHTVHHPHRVWYLMPLLLLSDSC